MNKCKNRVIIAGGRDLPICVYAIERVKKLLNKLEKDSTELVTGTAKGADQLVYEFKDQYPIKEFPADWDEHGKKAGPVRNRQMAEYATHLILFWDGKSKGSANMLKEAKKYGLKCKVISYQRRK